MLVERNFSSLTVREVTNTAGLNRTTFYLHYAGLHELLEGCARTLFRELRTAIYANEIVDFEQDTTVLKPFVESVFLHLEQNEGFYRAMLGRQGDPLFQGLFQELLSELIFEPIINIKPDYDRDPRFEMHRSFFSAGFAGLALWWLEKGKPMTIEQASLQITRDILPDYLRLMGK